MAFDFNVEKQKAAEEAATDKWDKARLFYEKIVFCIRSIEEVDNPWFSKDTDPVSVFQLVLGFIWQGRKNTIQTTYRVTPEMRILVAKHPAPWHNMKFDRYQTSKGSYGYDLAQVTPDALQCPWEMVSGRVQQAGHALIAGDTVDGSLVQPEEVSAILAEYDLDTPISEATQQRLLKASTLMMEKFGKRVDPGDFANMTERQGQQLLDTFRAQWLAESASQAKTSAF